MIKYYSRYIFIVGLITNSLHAHTANEFNSLHDTVASEIESIDMTKDKLDFEISTHTTDDGLNGIDIFRFDDADDYDLICDQLPIIQPSRWQLLVGNMTGAVVLRWNALSKLVGNHWNRLTKSFKKKKTRNRNNA